MPYEEYFKAASEALIVADHKGKILEINPKTERLFGYSQEELIGQPIELLVPASLRELHRNHVRDYFDAPRTRAMGLGISLAARRKDGGEFPVEISLTYAPGTQRGDLVVAAITDITERLALERDARRIETLTSLGTFAAGIAHDLNNPLQVIRSRCELVLDMPTNTPAEEINEDLVAIHRQAQRASRIVEEFLKLSRQREKLIEPVDIDELVDRVLLLIGDHIRKRGTVIQTNLARNLPPVMADATALERVLINLLTNAHDAMPHGGTLTVTSGLIPDALGWLYLTVADTGRGIDPEGLEKVFDLLYTTKTSGSGLGLWLSRRIVQEHEGKLDAHSELGKGASFTIRLRTIEPSGK